MPRASFCFFSCFWPFSEKNIKRSPNGIKPAEWFFHNRRYAGNLRTKAKDPGGGHKPPSRGLGARLAGLWAPRGSFALLLPPINYLKIRNHGREPWKYISAAASFCLRKIPSGDRSGALPEGGFGHGGLLHQHHCLSDEASAVHHRPSGPLLVARWLLLSLGSSIQSSPWSWWTSIRCILLLHHVCRDPMNYGFMIRLSMIIIWVSSDLLYAWFRILVILFELWFLFGQLDLWFLHWGSAWFWVHTVRWPHPVTEGVARHVSSCCHQG